MSACGPVVASGWLVRESGAWKSWQRRFFVLKDNKLSYFRQDLDRTPINVIQLDGRERVGAVEGYRGKKHVFQLKTATRTHMIMADTDSGRDGWVAVLNTAVSRLARPVAAASASPPMPAAGVQDFELLKMVGKGSFGKVMQVRHRGTGAVYAMKVLSKQHILEHNEIDHIMSELHVMQRIRHPFLVNLHWSFQTEDKLYFVLDFINGGELFHHLQRERTFSLDRVRFYGAEICLALECLHNAGIAYRDLKPENIIIANDGHLVMTDFGLCKEGLVHTEDRATTFCGTPEYLAPEITQGQCYGKAVDWWSFGAMLYEMIVGIPPFYSADYQEMYRRIISAPLVFPDELTSIAAKDLIRQLLDRNPVVRLADPTAIKRHPFFDTIDWDALYKKQVQPAFVPAVTGIMDTSQIDPRFTAEPPSHSIPGASLEHISTPDQQEFAGFTFVANQEDRRCDGPRAAVAVDDIAPPPPPPVQ